MTKDEALMLAMEAMEITGGFDVEINAIKEALAQPEQEPVAWPVGWVDDGGTVFWKDKPPADGADLYTSPPQPEPVIDKSAAIRIATALGWEPKRKPLTDKELNLIGAQWHYNLLGKDDKAELFAFARAIEAAHGIKE